MLLPRLRGESIKFASNLKKPQNILENNLITEIQDLEKDEAINIDILKLKKKNFSRPSVMIS